MSKQDNKNKAKHSEHKLNQFSATAICGNDILSSTLYVSGIAILFAGIYSPLVLAFIALVLLFYKSVYTEVVEALPINGGAYNCLLNGTSKTLAAIAGVMTILSYIATVVLSAKVGVEYLSTIIPGLPVIPITIALLLLFAVLVITGLKDSAKVALAIFGFHIFTLIAFLVLGLIFYLKGGSFFAENAAHTVDIIKNQGGLGKALYLAFAASLLGVSGFESSANFVEEQGKGVFRKTLRNMLIGVAIFNPLVALVVLNSMPYEAIVAAKDFLLSDAAHVMGGQVMQYVVVIDAFLVLSGAVLTGYIGVGGLIHRMALDGALPSFLAKRSKVGSFPRIVITFFLLCTSILLLTHGNLLSLAGVYTIAFLGVMTSFAVGNLILKMSRSELKRTYSAPVIIVILAALATFFGIIGNIRINPDNLLFFELYFIPSLLIVLAIIYQSFIFKLAVRISKPIPPLQRFIQRKFRAVLEGQFIAFIYNHNRLYEILHYLDNNENGLHVILVSCKDETSDARYRELKHLIPEIQKAGVFPHFKISIIYKDEPFGPKVVNAVSKEFDVPKNRILIGSIHEHHEFSYDDFGGVRVIF